MQNEIIQYITELNQIHKAGNATEHTYRPALKSLLEKITTGLTVTNEPKRIACGAPDYIVTRNEIPVGYIEAKDVGIDLNGKANKAQFDRYKQSLDNLIITDYLAFQLFEEGGSIISVTIAKIGKNGIEADTTQFEAFTALINLFVGYEGQGIQTSVHLSKVMADKARLMANIIENALNGDEKGDSNSLDGQLKGFREVLIHDITHKEFADIYAQTIAYGMFAAKLNNETNDTFTRSKAAQLIPHSNPFLRKLFQYIAGYDLDERIRWVVDDLSNLFNYVDIDEIIKEFDKNDHDPIIHFYETFLAEYDPALRKSRGVWYTPQPVVQFIVQAIDDILKQDFGLPQGLTDTSRVNLKQHVMQNDGSIKEEEKEYHRVQILDPATGTGTFLAEIVRNIYRNFKNQQGMWQSYADEHLIPRINGFEILMASYAMAHLKLDMLLQKTGVRANNHSPQRLRIYLTNSLEEAHAKTEIPFAQWLSDEANEANRIKQDVPVMVVLGNPPYSVSSQNKGKWINELLFDYKQGLNERNIQPLSDDYIKFIRYGQHFIEKSGEGILAYISNNSFIDGLIHRQMRKHLLETFDKIYILNLHGNAKKKEVTPDGGKDENVFDIQQGVSINIFVKTSNSTTLADVFHYDLYGKRTGKYDFLLNNNLQTIQWKQLDFNEDNYFFVPKNFGLLKEYESGFKIDELFNLYSTGLQTKRDLLFIDTDKLSLKQRLSCLLSGNLSNEFINKYNIRNSSSYNILQKIKKVNFDENKIRFICYRPFDVNYIYYDENLIGRSYINTMKHFIKGKNIGLLTCRQQSTFDFQHVFVSNIIADMCAVSLQTKETTYVFPLYLYPENDKLFSDEKRKPNLNENVIKEISQRLELQFIEEKEETKNTFSPIDILDYIYAVLHSPSYRERYKEFLKIDFPRVPYPENAEQFWKLVELGGKLRRLHLMEDVEPQEDLANYPVNGSNEIEKPEYENDKVYINDTQYFDHVPLEAWNFYIGGYQPAQKWLKDRKGRMLNFEDIRHYQKIISVLKETDEVMKQIEKITIKE